MVNDDQSNRDQQQTWRYSVRAFRWVADTLTNPLAQVVADFSAAERLPDLTPELPMVDFSPFQALSGDRENQQLEQESGVRSQESGAGRQRAEGRGQKGTSFSGLERWQEAEGRGQKATPLPSAKLPVARSPQFPIQSPDQRSQSVADTRSPLFSFKQRSSISPALGTDGRRDRTQATLSELSQSFRKSDNTEWFNTVSASPDLSGESVPSGSPLEQSIDLLNTLADDLLTTASSSSGDLQNSEVSDRQIQLNSPDLAPQAQQNSLTLDRKRSNSNHHSTDFNPSAISNRGMDQDVGAIAPLRSPTTNLLTNLQQSLESPSEYLSTPTQTTEIVGRVEPPRNPTSPSPILRDTPLSQPTILSLPDADQLAALVNEALIEQAQRHGVDLS